MTALDDLRKAGRRFARTQAARDTAGVALADAIRAAAAEGATWQQIIDTAGVARRTVQRALKEATP